MLYNVSIDGGLTDGFSEMAAQIGEFTPVQITTIVAVFLIIIFIPTFLGLIRNRRHIGKIFLLNIPASFTFTSWFLLMGLVLIRFDDFAELKNRLLRNKQEASD